MVKSQIKKVSCEQEVASEAPASFEKALEELESITEKLEGGRATLAETVLLCTRGRYLHDFCSTKLGEAQLTISNMTEIRANTKENSSIE